MILRKIPKRTVVISPKEFKDIFSLLFSKAYKGTDFIGRFENGFKQLVGTKEAIAVSSGRFAMSLILKNLGLKKEDRIIISAYNFRGVPAALLRDGFCPVLVDADMDTYQIDINKIEKKIDKNTKAIIATHLFGQPCDLAKILDIAKRYNLLLIEDAAHSIGSYYQGRHTGTIGDAGFFSFTGTKTINTSFGGMIVTDNLELAKKIRYELMNYSSPKATDLLRERLITYLYAFLTNVIFYDLIVYPISLFFGAFELDLFEVYNNNKRKEIAEQKMKFTNLQALLGLRQIDFVQGLVKKRKKIASLLIKSLNSSISVQGVPKEADANYFMFPIKTVDKYKVFKRLLFMGIDTSLTYATDCSDLFNNNMPAAKSLSQSILALNLPYNLNEKEVFYIVRSLNKIKNYLR